MVIEFKKPGITPETPASATVTLMRDGNQIVALLGPDLQAGIGGFGDTAMQALSRLLKKSWEHSRWHVVTSASYWFHVRPSAKSGRFRHRNTLFQQPVRDLADQMEFEKHLLPGIDF